MRDLPSLLKKLDIVERRVEVWESREKDYNGRRLGMEKVEAKAWKRWDEVWVGWVASRWLRRRWREECMMWQGVER